MEQGPGVPKELKQWSEEPRTLFEEIAWSSVENSSDPDGERDITWKGATKEPFLTLEANGWEKREYVLRGTSGIIVTVHFWESPGNFEPRLHLKVKSSWKDPNAKYYRNPY
jgi:hypothetical protein